MKEQTKKEKSGSQQHCELMPHEERIINLLKSIDDPRFMVELHSSINAAVLASHRHNKAATVQIDIKISPCKSGKAHFDVMGRIKEKFPRRAYFRFILHSRRMALKG